MKKITLLLCIISVLALAAGTAQAAKTSYTFDDIHARLTLDDAGYDMVLTPATLKDHEDWLKTNGIDLEQTTIRFEDDGVLKDYE